MQTTVTINGETHVLDHDPRTTLLDALRDGVGLTGAKKGCDHGQCGACTVLVNGRRVNACLALLACHDGDAVVTIEGMGGEEGLSPLQKAFIRHDGLQCGYCTPGQIMSAAGMLEEVRQGCPSQVSDSLLDHSSLDRTEVAERMSGNLCRCSAYPGIVAAILDVAGER